MNIEFTLPQKWIDPRNREHILLVANRIAAIRYGDGHLHAPVEIDADGTVHFPLTNDHWLYPPGGRSGRPKGHWLLVGRYDDREALGLIVRALQLWL